MSEGFKGSIKDGFSTRKACLLLSGTCNTGKDSLFRKICKMKKQPYDESKPTHDWLVCSAAYDNKGTNGPSLDEIGTLFAYSTHPVKRYSFADAVKNSTHKSRGLEGIPADHFESIKNTKCFIDPVTQESKSMRDFYIEHGMKERAKDPDVWIKQTKKEIDEATHDKIAVITDWRFENEKQVCKDVVTVRVFRGDVEIPKNEPSEHGLDNELADYLIIPFEDHEFHFEAAIQHYPQYKDYKRRLGLISLPVD